MSNFSRLTETSTLEAVTRRYDGKQSFRGLLLDGDCSRRDRRRPQPPAVERYCRGCRSETQRQRHVDHRASAHTFSVSCLGAVLIAMNQERPRVISQACYQLRAHGVETLEAAYTWAPARAMGGTSGSSKMDERLENAVLFMECNCHHKLSLRQVAAGVGMSRSRLSALFVAHLGVSPMRFLKTIRMRQARALIQSSSLNIKEIAAYAGFNDMSHFVRDFGRLYGKSPTTIRNSK
jgi:AraC-like DNA-binding protein